MQSGHSNHGPITNQPSDHKSAGPQAKNIERSVEENCPNSLLPVNPFSEASCAGGNRPSGIYRPGMWQLSYLSATSQNIKRPVEQNFPNSPLPVNPLSKVSCAGGNRASGIYSPGTRQLSYLSGNYLFPCVFPLLY